MASLKKYVLCKCGASNSFDFSSDMQVEDITVSARCQSCGATVHVSISALLASPSVPSPAQQVSQTNEAQQAVSEANEPSMLDNLDSETKEDVEQAVRDLFR